MGFSDWSWTIGVAIYMIGRSTMAFGANLQRYSMRKELERPAEERRSKTKQPLLMTGVVTYTGSGIFLSTALIFASPTLLAPCGTMIFASNCFFAYWLNEEKLEWGKEGVCIALIVVGTVLVVIGAPKNNDTYTNDELKELMQGPGFISFVTLVATLALIAFLWPRYIVVPNSSSSKVAPTEQPDSPAEGDTAVQEASFETAASQAEAAAAEDDELQARGCSCCASWVKMLTVHLSYGTLAGSLGAMNIIFSKTIFSLMGGEASENGIVSLFSSWMIYTFGAVMCFTYVSQMINTTIGLENTPAMVFVPVQSVTEETIAILGGLFYFKDFQKFDEVSASIFTVGECLSIIAVLRLTQIQISRGGGLSVLPPDLDTPDDKPAVVEKSPTCEVASSEALTASELRELDPKEDPNQPATDELPSKDDSTAALPSEMLIKDSNTSCMAAPSELPSKDSNTVPAPSSKESCRSPSPGLLPPLTKPPTVLSG